MGLHILHIITRLVQGGAQYNTLLSCEDQVLAGHRVSLVYGATEGPEGSLLDQGKASGAELIHEPMLVRSVRPWRDWRCRWALGRLIGELQPDVVHTHSSKAGILGRYAAWAVRQSLPRPPAIVHTIHGLPFHRRNGWLTNGLYIAAERRAARRCHRLIGLTQAMCTAFRHHDIGHPGQFALVPSGVDLNRFELSDPQRQTIRREIRQELGIEPEAPLIGVVARLDRLKGHDDLFNTLPLLKEAFPLLKVLVIGEGRWGDRLRERVSFSSLVDYTLFSGAVSPERVRQMLAGMDVCVLPSYQEGQGRTLVEAMLCGTPTVAYDAGGIPEVCREGETGLLVRVGHYDRLREALRWMLDHPQHRQAMGRRGRELARQRFSRPIMSRRLLELYEEVLLELRGEPAQGETGRQGGAALGGAIRAGRWLEPTWQGSLPPTRDRPPNTPAPTRASAQVQRAHSDQGPDTAAPPVTESIASPPSADDQPKRSPEPGRDTDDAERDALNRTDNEARFGHD